MSCIKSTMYPHTSIYKFFTLPESQGVWGIGGLWEYGYTGYTGFKWTTDGLSGCRGAYGFDDIKKKRKSGYNNAHKTA